MGSQTLVIAGSIVLAGVIIAAALFMRDSKPAAQNPNPGSDQSTVAKALEIGTAPVLGNADAPHTIVEFLDFQCPACGAYFTAIDPQIRQKYIDTGKAKMVAKVLTFIDSFDGNKAPLESMNAAVAAECAKEQGKFWAMHDAIYAAEEKEVADGKNNENSGNLTDEFFRTQAQLIGLSLDQFTSCYASQATKDRVATYMDDANAALNGEVSTPSVFIDGKKLAKPFDIKSYDAVLQ